MSNDEKVLRIEYVRLNEAIELLWKKNPKLHAISDLAESFKKHGFRDAPAFDTNLQEGGAIVDGNGRVETLRWMYDQEQKPPIGIMLDDKDGMWYVPIQFGVDAPSQAAAESYALDCNLLVMAGGRDFTTHDYARLWDEERYVALLQDLARVEELPVGVDGDDLDALLSITPKSSSEQGEGESDGKRWNECPKCGHRWLRG
jgi:hypothetical protein